MKLFITTMVAMLLATGAMASGKNGGEGNSGHVDNWHNTGDGHQANNEPGDTAADRHNFAGNPTPSGKDAGPKK